MAMSRQVGVIFGVIIFLGLIGGAVVWSQRPLDKARGEEGQRVTVAATIFPLADIVKNIGGEGLEVVLLIPPGVSEHNAALTPAQLQSLSNANVIFQIGSELDDHLVEKITGTFPEIRPVTVDRGITLKEFGPSEEEGHHHDEGVDPHYYLTAPNAMKIAQTVAGELRALDPDSAPVYAGRLADYQRRLVDLEAELQTMAQKATHKEFIAMHNAWSYFADQYGLTLLDTYEPREGKEPSLSDLTYLKRLVQEHGLRTFYAEPQKSTTAVSNFMQREFGLNVLTLDPVGGQGDKESYIDLMRANMAAMVAG